MDPEQEETGGRLSRWPWLPLQQMVGARGPVPVIFTTGSVAHGGGLENVLN